MVVQQHIRSQDILVVSVGGNDIALKPTLLTIAAMGEIWAEVS